MKSAIICMNGFEESEGITVVDILRRLSIQCDIVGVENYVTGSHDITIKTDRLLEDIKAFEYDAIIFPGGLKGAERLRESDIVIDLIKEMNDDKKIVGAICAAPTVLGKAGILKNRNYTVYPGITVDNAGNLVDKPVVKDNNIITSRGPATAMEFAFAIAEGLGVASEPQRDATLFSRFYAKFGLR